MYVYSYASELLRQSEALSYTTKDGALFTAVKIADDLYGYKDEQGRIQAAKFKTFGALKDYLNGISYHTVSTVLIAPNGNVFYVLKDNKNSKYTFRAFDGTLSGSEFDSKAKVVRYLLANNKEVVARKTPTTTSSGSKSTETKTTVTKKVETPKKTAPTPAPKAETTTKAS